MTPTRTQQGSKSPQRKTAIERQMLNLRVGDGHSPTTGRTPDTATPRTGRPHTTGLQSPSGSVRASTPTIPKQSKPETTKPEQLTPKEAVAADTAVADANANVTPLPLTPLRRVTPAGRKARLQALSSIQELIAARKQLLIGLYGGRGYSGSMRTEMQTVLDDQQKFWGLLERKRTIYPQDQQLFDQLGQAIQQHIQHTKRLGSFKQHLHKCAEAGAERQLFLIAELGKRLEAASLLNQDEVPPAVLAAYKALRLQIPGPALARQLSEKATLTEAVPSFAARSDVAALTSPAMINARKEAILARMEELTRMTLDPRERAREVKGLRSEWLAINRAHSEYTQSLAQRFNEMGELAYEPSRRYFSAVAKKLAQNLSKRSELATSLRDYYAETDWKAVEWKSVESTLSAVRQQWKAHAPTEREKTRPIKLLFETSYRNIDELLQREYDKNAREGQKLVELMSSLGRQKASSASLEAMLGVQNRWKKLGLMRTADRRELKTQLSTRASVVKQNRKKQLLQMQELRINRREALSLLQQIDALLNREDESLLDRRQDANVMRERFQMLMVRTAGLQLDRRQAASVQKLTESFNDKYALLVQKSEQLMQTRRVRALDAYHEASRLIGNAEVTYVIGSARSDVVVAADHASDYLGGVRFLPRNGHALLMNRLNYLNRPKD